MAANCPEHKQSRVSFDCEYADDTDFGSEVKSVIDFIRREIPGVFSKWFLKVNDSKTEEYAFQRGVTCIVKKLGCKVDSSLDIANRIRLSYAAFKNMYRLWLRDSLVSQGRRLRMYNAYVLPILCYNAGTVGPTEVNMRKLDVAHRKQLRIVLRMHYPVIVSNVKLYQLCRCVSLSCVFRRRRWSLFGHILRYPTCRNIFAQRVMFAYFMFMSYYPHFRGGQYKTLPVVLNEDLKYVGFHLQLKGVSDLERLMWLASNRQQWRRLTNCIVMTMAVRRPRHRQKRKRVAEVEAGNTYGGEDPDQCVGRARKRAKTRDSSGSAEEHNAQHGRGTKRPMEKGDDGEDEEGAARDQQQWQQEDQAAGVKKSRRIE